MASYLLPHLFFFLFVSLSAMASLLLTSFFPKTSCIPTRVVMQKRKSPSFLLCAKQEKSERETTFFSDFLDGVVKNLYLPSHTDLVSYNMWNLVSEKSLLEMEVDYERGEEDGHSKYTFQSLNEEKAKIILMEKKFLYFLSEVIFQEKKFFDLIQRKRREIEEKGEIDRYQIARLLKSSIKKIRLAYKCHMDAKDILRKQLALATCLIDTLAFDVGLAKDADEGTLGCCSLKVGDVECIPPKKLKFQHGKDDVTYANIVDVDPQLYRTILEFQAGKNKTDYLFHEINASMLNDHLKEFMPGLTAKVFHTYNASITLDTMLNQETRGGDLNEKLEAYQKAIKEVAIICNHLRTVSKSHDPQIKTFAVKIKQLKEGLEELKTNLDRAKEGKPPLAGSDGKKIRSLEPKAWEKKIQQQKAKIKKMEKLMHEKDDVKTVVLGASKMSYIDPRICVAWCKRHDVPSEKIFNESLLAKFAWARDAEPDFRF